MKAHGGDGCGIIQNTTPVSSALHGSMKAYQDNYGAYISRDANLLEVGQCLVADGKTLNFNILHPDTGRPCRMTLILFFDWVNLIVY